MPVRQPADQDEEGPERTCAVTRRKGPPEALLRFVLGPDGAVVPDIRRRLPGRGVWVSASAGVVAEAVRRQAFARGFKTAAQAAETLPADVDALLERDALQAVAMANKAGLVITGFAKIEAAIGKAPMAALLHAREASADGIRKLWQVVRRHRNDEDPGAATARFDLFDGCQLDLALGRANVIHAALAAGPASSACVARCRRLARYRGATTDSSDDDMVLAEAGCPAVMPVQDDLAAGPARGFETNE